MTDATPPKNTSLSNDQNRIETIGDSPPYAIVCPEFAEVFLPSCVDVVRGRVGRSSILSQLVALCVRSGIVDRDKGKDLVRLLLGREKLSSTAIGRGLAIPHLRTDAVSNHAGAAIVCPEGIEFAAPDGSPTHLVVLLLSPSNAREQHTHLMSRLASLMHDKRLGCLIRNGLDPNAIHSFLVQ